MEEVWGIWVYSNGVSMEGPGEIDLVRNSVVGLNKRKLLKIDNFNWGK